MMPKVSVTRYRQDPLHARIASATQDVLRRGPVVTPVDVLIAMRLLTREHLEDWRRGRIPYLERVINCNLPRLARVLRILKLHAEELGLKPSVTAYMRWGRGPKARLRFTKTGDPNIEEAYATHFLARRTAPLQTVTEEGAIAPRQPRIDRETCHGVARAPDFLGAVRTHADEFRRMAVQSWIRDQSEGM